MEGKKEDASSVSSVSPKEASVYDDPVYLKYKNVLKGAEYVRIVINIMCYRVK